MNKSQLGFACGKNCPHCGDAVALDCFGQYTCFTCGRRVTNVKDGKKYEQIRLPISKNIPKL